SADLVRHQPCISISHPGGDDSHHGLVVRFGYVVDIHERGHIHNTCLMEPGDSGGGLFDLAGRLIGIRSYILQPLSANFDIPIDTFREHWDALCEQGEFNPPYAAPLFGIVLESSRASDQGAQIAAVVEASPAAEAGLQAGDWITRVHETKVTAGFRIARELRRRMDGENSDLALEIRRNDQPQNVKIQRHLPEHPETKEDPSARYDAMTRLAEEFSPLEEQLDDCTVRITSDVNENENSTLGTLFRRDGLVVSKNSRIGESPAILDHLEKKHPARVVARDEGNDLVLLKVDDPLEGARHLHLRNEYLEGTILISPRPGVASGLVSVVGSKPVPSPRKKQNGYLGVELDLSENGVIIRQILDGPAKQVGIRPDDVVLKIGDKPVSSVSEMIGMIRAHEPGQTIRVLVKRDDREKDFLVALASMPMVTGRHVADEFAGGPSLRRAGFDAVFCHDAHIEPHECGGPVFDIDGHFMGLNIARFSRTRCYALPAKIVRQFVDQFESKTTAKSTSKQDGTLAP
ncbi:MAG: PDZ domain-containing protein, partial [Pirellulales bacterium]|nr:PDZ domain-containing protein [Pirellulales bacterium]